MSGASFWKELLPWSARRKRLRELAAQAAACARQLHGLPSEDLPSAAQDPLELLESACRLLADFVERQAAVPTAEIVPAPVEPSLSSTAQEVIKLRDWLLLKEAASSDRELLGALYRKMGQALQKEGVYALEDGGAFDPEQQQIVETRPTADSAQHDQVASTVRPGYRYRGRLLRPQEVILYRFETLK